VPASYQRAGNPKRAFSIFGAIPEISGLPAPLRGPKPKAPGFAGGYLLAAEQEDQSAEYHSLTGALANAAFFRLKNLDAEADEVFLDAAHAAAFEIRRGLEQNVAGVEVVKPDAPDVVADRDLHTGAVVEIEQDAAWACVVVGGGLGKSNTGGVADSGADGAGCAGARRFSADEALLSFFAARALASMTSSAWTGAKE
jgi:hypothetical protein